MTIPSIADIFDNLASDLQSKLGLDDTQLKLAMNAIAANLTGQLKLIYLLVVDVQRNTYPDTADPAADGGDLERLGMIWLKRLPFTATAGVYTAAVVGSAGAVLPAQLTFKSNADSNSPGNLYVLANSYTLTGTDDVITLTAVNAGEDFLLNAGDHLTATQPLLNVNGQATIAGVTTQPTNAEDIELYRQQVLNAMVLMPQGGSKTDYRLWAQDAAGVQQVYPYVKNGAAGTVQVYVEATPGDSTDGFGTPSDALLEAVTAVLLFSPDETLPTNQRGRAPIQAAEWLEVDPVVVVPVDVTVTSLTTDTPAIEESIQAALVAYLATVRPYIAGCDLPRDQNNVLTAVRVQSIVSDTVGNANSFLAFTLDVDGGAVVSYEFDGGQTPYLRNLIFN